MRELEAAGEPRGGTRELKRIERTISFDRVSFTYPTAIAPALSQISLRIPANGLTAIVGPSGSGKSTLIDLIPRLRDPTSGSIRIDDVPLAEFSISSLRQGISFVPQTPFLFNVSVADHIRYGKPGATDSEVHSAAELAGVTRFIDRLSNGYNTICGETGVMLSAGQRQRIDLARALLHGGSILILDEPTSALDAESEDAFHDALTRLHRRRDRTIIVVAHRLHTVIGADLIVVIEHGRLTETGVHDELARAGRWYARAYGGKDPLVYTEEVVA
jgi:ABC-type multidrug transport system fused ATPase/permease subunit